MSEQDQQCEQTRESHGTQAARYSNTTVALSRLAVRENPCRSALKKLRNTIAALQPVAADNIGEISTVEKAGKSASAVNT